MYCSNCGKTLADGSMFCNYCGAKQILKNVCSQCGTELPTDAMFCHKCGTRIGGNDNPTEMHCVSSGCESAQIKNLDRIDKYDEIKTASYTNCAVKSISHIIEDEVDRSKDTDFEIENGTLLRYTGSAKILYIPKGVSKINSGVFNGYTGITKVVFPEGLSTIDERAFSACQNLKEIVFNSGLRTIGEYAFYMCKSLEEITVPNTITCINKGVFAGCSSLRCVDLSEGLKMIKDLAFNSCNSLTKLFLPKSVLRISSNAFYGCNNMTLIVYKSSRSEAFAYENRISFESI